MKSNTVIYGLSSGHIVPQIHNRCFTEIVCEIRNHYFVVGSGRYSPGMGSNTIHIRSILVFIQCNTARNKDK